VFTGPARALIGKRGGIVFSGTVARSAYEGTAPPLHTPEPFAPGTSLSHFAESIPGTLIMKHELDPGEAVRT
jgi:hypothetical protein